MRKLWLIPIILLLLVTTVTAIQYNTARYIDVFASNGSTFNATEDYSTNMTFKIQPPKNESWIISRLLVTIEDFGTFDAAEYGNGIMLTNGIRVATNQSGRETNITNGANVMSNAHWARFSYDTTPIDFGTGNNFLAVRWTFSKSGTWIKLDGSTNDSINVILRDDFSGLVTHTFNFQGFQVENNVESIRDDSMASLALTMFLLAIIAGLFVLNLNVRFSKGMFLNLILKRCLWLFILALMWLNTAIMFTITNLAGMGLEKEMTRYLWIFGLVILLSMMFITIKTFFEILGMWQQKKYDQRMGNDQE